MQAVEACAARLSWLVFSADLGLASDADDYDGINDALQLPGPIPVTLAFDATGQEVARIEGAAEHEQFRELARTALGLTAAPASGSSQ